MAIPDFQTLMLPLLEIAADGKEHDVREARELLAKKFGLTDEETKVLLPSGRQALFTNRVAWAKVYLQHAKVLDSPRRGYFKISSRGREVLAQKPDRVTVKYLERFPEFVEFRTAERKPKEISPASIGEENQTPEETLELAYQRLRHDMAADLLIRVKGCSAQFFEKLVVEVLIKMGYGGSRREAGEAIGQSGDEGIDGIINEDRLGLDVIYLQAKKWNGTVGRPEIQKFVGALHGKRSRKGVFITTGAFSDEAEDYIAKIDPKVVLIGGHQLAELMIDFNVGVVPANVYETKRIDSDYFEEE
jgi:restriction system protein